MTSISEHARSAARVDHLVRRFDLEGQGSADMVLRAWCVEPQCYRANLAELACQLHLVEAAAVGRGSAEQIEFCELTVDNAVAKVQEFIDGDLASCVRPDGQFAGRGIVINAGKPKYSVGAYVLIRLLRELGCRLPIKV